MKFRVKALKYLLICSAILLFVLIARRHLWNGLAAISSLPEDSTLNQSLSSKFIINLTSKDF